TEGTLTWSNRPPLTGPAADDRGAVVAGAWVEYDVTSLVTGDGPVAFALVPTSADGVDLHAREASHPPELVVCTTGCPALVPSASVETTPVPHGGGAADDPAIWVHPTDPAR